jgi:RecB family exonuclease
MAEREVVLSYPTVNEQGNQTVPSPFLDELRRCYRGELPTTELDATALVPPAEDCCEAAELIGRASLERWSRRPGAPPDRLSAALGAARPDLAARLTTIDRRATIEERRTRYFLSARGEGRKEALADRFVGRLSTELAAVAQRIGSIRWNPGRLDALGACGFKFFARDVLGLKQEDDPEAEVGRKESGTLAHGALEALFEAHARLPANLDAARALAREYVAGMRDRLARSISAKDRALLDVTWRQVEAAIDALIAVEHARQAEDRRDGVAVERILEQPFAWTLSDPAGGPGLSLYGQPDRVELRRRDGVAVGLRVLDYKMSRNRTRYAPFLDPAKALGRTAFQIAVYLLGARARFPDLTPDATLEGGYLLLLAAKMEMVAEFTGAQLDEIAGRALALVERARQGRFDVDPDPCDPYCGYRAVCRYQRPPLEEEAGGA